MAGTDKIAMMQDELERLLRRAGIEDLRAVAKEMELEIAESDDSEKERRKILRLIQDTLDDNVNLPEAETMFENLVLPKSMKDMYQVALRKCAVESAKIEVGEFERPANQEGEYGKLMLKRLEDQQNELLRIQKEVVNQTASESSGRLRSDSTLSAVEAIKSLGLKKDLRIQGTIGGNDDKRLNFISLQSQVLEAKKKGYTEEEVAFALRRAVASGSELRQYLDALGASISLSETMDCIRSAYKEKAASELFNDLRQLKQQPNEDNKDFLFRSLALKAKMKAAARLESEYEYSDGLIEASFKRAFYTGLKDNATRVHLKTLLQTSSTATDKDLIEEVTKVSAEETEFSAKHAAKTVRVHEITVESQVQASVKPLADSLKQMSDQLAEMQKEIILLRSTKNGKQGSTGGDSSQSPQVQNPQQKTQNSNRQTQKFRPRRPSCQDCTAKNLRCEHCIKCGQMGHMIADCPSN